MAWSEKPAKEVSLIVEGKRFGVWHLIIVNNYPYIYKYCNDLRKAFS